MDQMHGQLNNYTFTPIFLLFSYGFITFETQEDAEKIIKKEVNCN